MGEQVFDDPHLDLGAEAASFMRERVTSNGSDSEYARLRRSRPGSMHSDGSGSLRGLRAAHMRSNSIRSNASDGNSTDGEGARASKCGCVCCYLTFLARLFVYCCAKTRNAVNRFHSSHCLPCILP